MNIQAKKRRNNRIEISVKFIMESMLGGILGKAYGDAYSRASSECAITSVQAKRSFSSYIYYGLSYGLTVRSPSTLQGNHSWIILPRHS